MKRKIWTAGLAAAAVVMMNGCDSTQKAEAHVQKIEAELESIAAKLDTLQQSGEKGAKGVVCDNADALLTLKSLMDENSDGEYEVDRKNIVVWDYNPVGRYTCRAKVKKVSDKNPLGKKISAMMSGMVYGLSDGGWIHYHTYITTQGNDNFYVGLDTVSK